GNARIADDRGGDVKPESLPCLAEKTGRRGRMTDKLHEELALGGQLERIDVLRRRRMENEGDLQSLVLANDRGVEQFLDPTGPDLGKPVDDDGQRRCDGPESPVLAP